jgi:enamine deaminase RidA (YjgF/YER057c/UK114 family)
MLMKDDPMTFAALRSTSCLAAALLLAPAIASAAATDMSVPPGATIHFISGQVPPIVDKAAGPDTIAAFGDTRTQTVGVLQKIKEILAGMGLGMGDVVKMQVFLVGDPAQKGRADVTGFMAGYTQFFGGAQPNLPARAVMQVAGLSNAGWLVEIEVVAAKK